MNNIVYIDGKKYLATFTEIDDSNEYITIKEASTIYGIKATKLYNMIRLKQFPDGVVIKERGTATKFKRDLFCEYIEKVL